MPVKITLASVLFAGYIVATERPAWVKKIPKDAKYKYYVGHAAEAKTLKLATEIATRHAREQAIAENFGITTKVSRHIKETLLKTDYKKKYVESSEEVKIFGFEKMENYEEGANFWILFRYPKSEITKERQRQRELAQAKKAIRFSEVGKEKDKDKGILEVVTTPEDVKVYIDNEPWGRTPLRLTGKLSPGVHQLILEKGGFETVKQEIIIAKNSTEKINHKMVRGHALIKMKTTPIHGADVTINGKRIGLTPTDYIKVEAGIPLKVEISHAEAEYQVFTTELGVDEKTVREVPLQIKPALLNVSIFPRDSQVSIEMDAEESKLDNLRNNRVESHKLLTLRAQKEGYLPYEEVMTLKGGEKKHVKIRLRRDTVYITKEDKEKLKEERKEEDKKNRSMFLTQYISVGLSSSSGNSPDDSGTGEMGFIDAALTGHFVLPSGSVHGLGVRLSWGNTGKEDDQDIKRHISMTKIALFFLWNLQASESYTAEFPPRLRPLNGFFVGLGAGQAQGQIEYAHSAAKYKFATGFLSLRGGYDWRYLYASAGWDSYQKLPAGPANLKLAREFTLSVGLRLEL